MIQRQTEHLAHLIEDLLDIARITAAKMILKRRPIDLADVVERYIHTLGSDGKLAERRLETDLAPAWVNARMARS